MSVQTLTTNETNTVESTSTLSFPNSSETEITYNTNPSIITSEVNSNSTLVFPSEDGSNSTLVFESNETTSEDISNSTLIFPSENVSNSTPMFESNETTEERFIIFNNNCPTINEIEFYKMYGFCLAEPGWEDCWTDQEMDSCLRTKNEWTKATLDVFGIDNKDCVLHNYYIESTQNDATNKPWWTSYENHFIGHSILIIDRKEGKIDGICFVRRLDVELGLQLNKYDLLINNIFTDKNSVDTLKERSKKAIKIRDQQIGNIMELIIQKLLNKYRKKRNFNLENFVRKNNLQQFLALFLKNKNYDILSKGWKDFVRNHTYLTRKINHDFNCYDYMIHYENKLYITQMIQNIIYNIFGINFFIPKEYMRGLDVILQESKAAILRKNKS